MLEIVSQHFVRKCDKQFALFLPFLVHERVNVQGMPEARCKHGELPWVFPASDGDEPRMNEEG